MILLRSHQLKPKASLEDIFAEDDVLGLLDVEPLKPKSAPIDLVSNQFGDIVAFFEQHGRAPQNSYSADMSEKRLARRLQAIRTDPEQCRALSGQDIHDLLAGSEVVGSVAEEHEQYHAKDVAAEAVNVSTVDTSELVTSLDDIFADDDLGLLDFDVPDIFSMQHVPREKKALPDEIAQRQACPDFSRFAPLFEAVKTGLQGQEFSLVRYRNEHGFQVGDFFILNGVMGYVHSTGERLEQYERYNARLHLVFDNGTELHMLYQSLTQGLIRDKEGRKVMLGDKLLLPNDAPIPSGFVYVLATKSTDPVLMPFKQNLYKIGFTEGSVEERIKHADKDKTFLQAPVRIITTFQCFNMNTHKLETLIHGFLAKQRLDITLKGVDGTSYAPREWFHTPLATVLEVIQHILDGTISQYRMDNTTGKIVAKKINIVS
ncbi:GIY-YIG nuclease family protein [Aeromonas veronii]|uniref:GIY-YIG nuclease family protein n=1 Tax=Aeromonas veronii TaxID=654 RepID=UPI00191DB0EB|nr:GIY-YIG nuclease family protein [Aeromonas veronii]MBL0467371.1 GIY-YIG nuclease family protein [Aeromonas veronii]